MSSKLEKATNVAIIITCIVFSSFVILDRRTRTRHLSRPDLALGPGDRLGEIAGLDLDRSETTVLLAVKSTCKFCTESMPFYRDLVRRRDPQRTRIVGLTPESSEAGSEYFRRYGVVVDEVLSIAPGDLRIRATPTMILVSRSGEVLAAAVGKVEMEKQAELMARFLSLS